MNLYLAPWDVTSSVLVFLPVLIACIHAECIAIFPLEATMNIVHTGNVSTVGTSIQLTITDKEVVGSSINHEPER